MENVVVSGEFSSSYLLLLQIIRSFCLNKAGKYQFCVICNTCGDQFHIDIDGEECDLGEDNAATAKCNKECLKTYCGDGTIQSPNGFDYFEECV